MFLVVFFFLKNCRHISVWINSHCHLHLLICPGITSSHTKENCEGIWEKYFLTYQDRRVPHPVFILWVLATVVRPLCRRESSGWLLQGNMRVKDGCHWEVSSHLSFLFSLLRMLQWKCRRKSKGSVKWEGRVFLTMTMFLWWFHLVACFGLSWWVWTNTHFQGNNIKPDFFSLPAIKPFPSPVPTLRSYGRCCGGLARTTLTNQCSNPTLCEKWLMTHTHPLLQRTTLRRQKLSCLGR